MPEAIRTSLRQLEEATGGVFLEDSFLIRDTTSKDLICTKNGQASNLEG